MLPRFASKWRRPPTELLFRDTRLPRKGRSNSRATLVKFSRNCDVFHNKNPTFPMIEKILAAIFVFIKSVIGLTGYGGIAILMAIESGCIPLPSELIMPFAGYLVTEGSMKLFWVATAGAIGCNLGSLIAYEIGYYGGRPLVERYGRWVLMGRRELDWADHFFTRWGYLAVL